jgi:two-component system, NarL family, response regulator DevR
MGVDLAGQDPASPMLSMRVCVVEDDPIVRDWLLQQVPDAGAEVVAVAGSAAQGLDVIMSRHPDLAIVDSELPDGRGIDLCRTISASVYKVFLILFTGMISPLEANEAFEAGVDRIVLKTIRGEELMQAVRSFAARPGRAGD